MGKLNKILCLCVTLFISSNAFAAVYSFSGEFTGYDSEGVPFPQGSTPVFGFVDFDPDTFTGSGGIIQDNSPKIGGTIFNDIQISDLGDGFLAVDFTLEVLSISTPGSLIWQITALPDGEFNVFTVDGNGDGIPGLPLSDVFPGFSIALDGTLTAVPIPAAVWLFGSGLLGLFAYRRKAVTN